MIGDMALPAGDTNKIGYTKAHQDATQPSRIGVLQGKSHRK